MTETTPVDHDPTEFLKHEMAVGELVYLDSMAGLIPAKVVTIEEGVGDNRLYPSARITVRVTTSIKPGYKKGEEVSCLPRAVVARRAVYVRNRHFRIMQLNYSYVAGP